ncbi:MAG: FAD-dependent oxidoreductase [Longimicrobiales bacterium]
MSSSDVIVIGGGIAGVTAALTTRAAGASVTLIRAAPGATALSCGGWRGPMPALITDALSSAGLPYALSPLPLPHPTGELRTYDFASLSHITDASVNTALVCGIAGLSGFVAPALSRLYATSDSLRLAHATAVMEATPPAGWAPLALAAAIERDPASFARAVRPLIPRGVTHIITPAVLGLENGDGVRNAIAREVGIPVVEGLGATPSIPGLRLDRALMRALRNAGASIVTGRVTGVNAAGGRVASVTVDARSSDAFTAERFVLASGKFLGGGVATRMFEAHEQRLIESAFDLPVWIDHLDQVFTTAESLTLTSRVRTYDQPLLRAGVHVDASHRPVDPRDRALYDNVIAVGSLLAGTDAGEGLGFACGQALQAVSQFLSATSTDGA